MKSLVPLPRWMAALLAGAAMLLLAACDGSAPDPEPEPPTPQTMMEPFTPGIHRAIFVYPDYGSLFNLHGEPIGKPVRVHT